MDSPIEHFVSLLWVPGMSSAAQVVDQTYPSTISMYVDSVKVGAFRSITLSEGRHIIPVSVSTPVSLSQLELLIYPADSTTDPRVMSSGLILLKTNDCSTSTTVEVTGDFSGTVQIDADSASVNYEFKVTAPEACVNEYTFSWSENKIEGDYDNYLGFTSGTNDELVATKTFARYSGLSGGQVSGSTAVTVSIKASESQSSHTLYESTLTMVYTADPCDQGAFTFSTTDVLATIQHEVGSGTTIFTDLSPYLTHTFSLGTGDQECQESFSYSVREVPDNSYLYTAIDGNGMLNSGFSNIIDFATTINIEITVSIAGHSAVGKFQLDNSKSCAWTGANADNVYDTIETLAVQIRMSPYELPPPVSIWTDLCTNVVKDLYFFDSDGAYQASPPAGVSFDPTTYVVTIETTFEMVG